ncbi:MAG: glycosyltransferase family 2 protein [bacterium]|nr:glycosyltransferase family 2 protein [bacterium]
MYKNQSLSLVMPAYNEKEAVAEVISGYKKLGIIDEIIVVDNNSTDGTGEKALNLGVRVVKEPKQGYGYACIRGLKEATGDLVIIIECDGTFRPEDVDKLLKYIEGYDMVIGSRVHNDLNHANANMDRVIRWGNFVLAKVMEVFYAGDYKLNDVGCTFRVIKKASLERFVDKLRIGGEDFTPELTFEALKANAAIIQIPISYQPRIGESKLSPDRLHSIRIGLKHFFHIISRRF